MLFPGDRHPALRSRDEACRPVAVWLYSTLQCIDRIFPNASLLLGQVAFDNYWRHRRNTSKDIRLPGFGGIRRYSSAHSQEESLG